MVYKYQNNIKHNIYYQSNLLIMEKFKTLNNHICKSIVRDACNGHYRAVYMMIYNLHESMSEDLLVRVYNLCYELCPLTLDIFETLPEVVKSYYNSLWLHSLKK